MHVAGTATYEAGIADAHADGGIDIDRIRAYVTSRLHLIPRYRQRLAYVPLENHPVWIDDDHFNIHYHVRHTALPRPGDERQLKRLAARIMSAAPRSLQAAVGDLGRRGARERRPLRDDLARSTTAWSTACRASTC